LASIRGSRTRLPDEGMELIRHEKQERQEQERITRVDAEADRKSMHGSMMARAKWEK
jgi:hypothetical protein